MVENHIFYIYFYFYKQKFINQKLNAYATN